MTSPHAEVAKLIRRELKEKFGKNTKFSVRSSSFAGGNAVDVSWVDGPRIDEVDPIVNKYQDGHFDGMTDMYVHGPNKDHPTVKFVQTHRDFSDEKLEAATEELAEYYGIEDVEKDIEWDKLGFFNKHMAARIHLNKKSF